MPFPGVPQKYFPDFLRGYFDGDGHVWSGIIHKKRRTQHKVIQTAFTSCSEKFLMSMRQELSNYSIEGGMLKVCKKECYRLYYSVRASQKIYALMYKNASQGMYLERKKRVFDTFFESE